MKRFLCLILSLFLVFSFVSCANNDEKTDKNLVDVEYFAKLGQIPECEYKIGDSSEKIKKELEATQSDSQDEHQHDSLQVVEGEKSVLIDNGNYCYYYLKEKSNKGISYIVSFDNAFGFEIGVSSAKIKKALSEFEYKEEPVNSENAFFMLSTSGDLLRYTFSDYTLNFVFDNDSLCATALYLTEDWQ